MTNSKGEQMTYLRRNIMSFYILFGLLIFTPIAQASYTHSAALFLGAKTLNSNTNLAVGVDYEYQPLPLIGVVAFAEQVSKSPTQTAFGAGLALHPIPLFGLKLVAAPGLEAEDGIAHFLLRTGAVYELSLGPVFAGPAVYLDFSNGHTGYVYGVIAGVGF